MFIALYMPTIEIRVNKITFTRPNPLILIILINLLREERKALATNYSYEIMIIDRRTVIQYDKPVCSITTKPPTSMKVLRGAWHRI